MSNPNQPGDLPPEYAEAYRRGFERGYDQPGTDEEPLPSMVAREYDGPTARRPPGHRADRTSSERSVLLVPALLVALVVLLLAGAYGMAKAFSSSVADTDVTAEVPDGVDIGETEEATKTPRGRRPQTSRSPSPSSPSPTKELNSKVPRATTEAAVIEGASASCETAPSVDSAGNPVSYAPTYAIDQDISTAWRCDGDGVGQSITLSLAGDTRIAELGLVPGYAKTDSTSGADRYAENNRITSVRWTFLDGTSMDQDLDGSATNRALQTTRIPVTTSASVVLEVLASTPGPRDTIAVSDIRIGAVAE